MLAPRMWFGEGERMSPLERTRARDQHLALSKVKALSTCLVPHQTIEIPRTDKLIRLLHKHYDVVLMSCCAVLLVSLTSDMILLAMFLAREGSIAKLIIAGLVNAFLFTTSYFALLTFAKEQHCNTFTKWVYNCRIRKIQRKELKRASKQASQLALKNGWRPQEGLPHPDGKDDTYDRWLVEAHVTEAGVVLGLRRWHYADTKMYSHHSLPKRVWTPMEKLEKIKWFEDEPESVSLIGDYRAVLEAEAKTLEQKAQLHFAEEKASVGCDNGSSNKEVVKYINDSSVAAI
jgi:hypothetical protein